MKFSRVSRISVEFPVWKSSRSDLHPTKTCLGIGTVIVIFLRGYSLLTFELICVTTAVALSLSLALISSIPTMIDLYCNCHNLIGLLGWMNITSNMLQLGRFHHFRLNL